MSFFDKEKRQKKKALSEAAVVKTAVDILREKRNAAARECGSLNADIAALEKKIKIYKDAGYSDESVEVLDIIDDLKTLDAKLSTKEVLRENFTAVHQSMDELYTKVEAIIELGWYKYLVRIIPAHKLGKLVKNEKDHDFEAITKLIIQIKQKMHNRLDRTVHDKAKKESATEHIDKVSAQISREDRARTARKNAERVARAYSSAAARETRINPADLIDTANAETAKSADRKNYN